MKVMKCLDVHILWVMLGICNLMLDAYECKLNAQWCVSFLGLLYTVISPQSGLLYVAISHLQPPVIGPHCYMLMLM